MSKLIKKILASLLIAVFLLFSVRAPYAKAQQPQQAWYNQKFDQWSSKVFDEKNPNEIFGERYTYAQVTWIFNSLTAIVVGPGVTKCMNTTSTGNLSGVGDCLKLTADRSGGTILPLAVLTNTLVNTKAASGVNYIKETATRMRVIPQAYAQTGTGFASLQPVQTLWGVVRNITYSLMVLVIMILAFMIMFRVKISPQVVITVQSALPKIVIALILITFSYAIAGLLLDFSYVIVGVFAAMIKIVGGTITLGPPGTPGGVSGGLDAIGLFNQLISGNGLWSIVVGLLVFAVLLFVVGFAAFSAGFVGSFLSFGATSPAMFGGLLFLLVAVLILFIVLRVLWTMVRTLAITILLVVLGPLMILMGVFSDSTGFSPWIRILAANMAVYPTIVIILFLSHYFFWGWALGPAAGTFGSPGTGSFNTYAINTSISATNVNTPSGSVSTSVLGFILAFVLLFLLPKAVDIIQGVITGKGVDIGKATTEALAPPQAALAGHFAKAEEYNKLAGGTGKNPTAQFLRSLGLKV